MSTRTDDIIDNPRLTSQDSLLAGAGLLLIPTYFFMGVGYVIRCFGKLKLENRLTHVNNQITALTTDPPYSGEDDIDSDYSQHLLDLKRKRQIYSQKLARRTIK